MLSILICTMPSRRDMFVQLRTALMHQVKSCHATGGIRLPVQILEDDRVGITTGLKRQWLLKMARGSMIVYFDDDDWPADDYVLQTLLAMKKMPDADCIGIQGWMTTDGQNREDWRISKDYGSWYKQKGIYYRTPNHISPVRREIALQVGFPDKNIGEDYDYSMGILPLLKKEVKIDKDLYHYRFVNK